MRRRPPRSTRTDTLLPYPTPFRSAGGVSGKFGPPCHSIFDPAIAMAQRDQAEGGVVPDAREQFERGPQIVRPSQHLDRHSSAFRSGRDVEAVEFGHVVAQNPLLFLLRQVGGVPGEKLLTPRPG